MATLKAAYKNDEEKWRAESDVRTLVEAKQITADKARHARAMKCAREQHSQMSKVLKEGKS